MLIETILTYVADRQFVYQLLATVFTYLTIRIILFYRTRQRRYQLFKYYGIPGPKPRLFDGNLYLYKEDKALFKTDEKFCKQYGKTFGVFIGDQAIINTTDLELLRQIFFEKIDYFKERSTYFFDSPLSDGILLAKHDRWKLFRKSMTPLFSGYTIRGQESTLFIEEGVRLMLQYIDAKYSDDSDGGSKPSIDINDLMKATALHMISNLALKLPGIQVMENEEHIQSLDAYLKLNDNGIVGVAIAFPILTRVVELLAKYVEHGATMSEISKNMNNLIDGGLKRLAGRGGQDSNDNNDNKQQLNLIDSLIKLHYEGRITRKEVIGNLEAILVAGYDTTSTTLTYLLWVLSKHPKIQGKLRDEFKAHGHESRYLEQVINETMRLYPTVTTFTARHATSTVKIGDQIIPQGTKVHHNSWLINRSPDIWPEPEKFDPERFHDGAKIHPCAFAPFGLGERKCLGYKLAWLEIKTIVCDLLLRYRLKLEAPQELDLITYSVVLTKPKEKVMITFERL